MTLALTGATRLFVIVGDPIAQVKAPGGLTREFAARGHDGLVVPGHVAPADLAAFLIVADRLRNLDGIIATVPHKFACFQHCTSATARSSFLRAANLLRRRADGGWHGDMLDGIGFVDAVRAQGFTLHGKRALLAGAGGAGSAIALALIEAGVTELAIHDDDAARRDGLIGRLAGLGKGCVVVGSADPSGFDFIANATPAGMKAGDASPFDIDRLSPRMFVGCVITSPVVPPLIERARAIGCATSTGSDMYQAIQAPMLAFLLHADRERSRHEAVREP